MSMIVSFIYLFSQKKKVHMNHLLDNYATSSMKDTIVFFNHAN